MTYSQDVSRQSKVLKIDELVTWVPEFVTHFYKAGPSDYLVYQIFTSTYHTQPKDKRRKSEIEIRICKETFRTRVTTFEEADNIYRYRCLNAFGKLQSDMEIANLLEESEMR